MYKKWVKPTMYCGLIAASILILTLVNLNAADTLVCKVDCEEEIIEEKVQEMPEVYILKVIINKVKDLFATVKA